MSRTCPSSYCDGCDFPGADIPDNCQRHRPAAPTTIPLAPANQDPLFLVVQFEETEVYINDELADPRTVNALLNSWGWVRVIGLKGTVITIPPAGYPNTTPRDTTTQGKPHV